MTLTIADRLLHWYDQHRRQLPWRGDPDPYAVWVSEIMLQQTRVDTVIPYYDRWLAQFPAIADLAAASLEDVLKLWEGLGYYSRARNLHQAAQQVVRDFGGQLPNNLQDLRTLSGVGRYTAGAIASICFDLDEPTLDGNIRRVLSRLFDVVEPLGSSQGDRILWELARTHLPSGRAGDYNQAWMDLGATICTPRNPQCELCPLRSDCQAYGLGIQSDRPVPKPRKQIPQRSAVAAIILSGSKVLLTKRQEKGLLGGLWEFPCCYVDENFTGDSLQDASRREGANLPKFLHQFLLTEFSTEFGSEFATAFAKEFPVETYVPNLFGTYKHAYTHFRVTLHAYLFPFKESSEKLGKHPCLDWVAIAELSNYPMGKLARQMAQKLAKA
ncbi:A/G-specific adenine glycosylase [Tumidithrix elongata RA019]|uniref:Adenine DNA glycosylase n=1 Tax=Tumidithrix elongata BACA0141 TaxID=2716417 RepID=A0AAW9PYS1_9CYAN|nr:A/G-specific adenine glycosylase [Tumidithrix elongata RA019]